MTSINTKTLQDLEFNTVLETISALCTTEAGKEAAMEICPFKTEEGTMRALRQTSEYVSSYTNNNIIPNHYFDSIDYELKFLGIENSFLEVSSFKKIATLTETTITLISFLKKFEEYYPNLYFEAEQTPLEKSILKEIDNVLDKYGEIKDNA
ncbi:MAG: endonuclease MutS2, partial [Flavobacterium sp.]